MWISSVDQEINNNNEWAWFEKATPKINAHARVRKAGLSVTPTRTMRQPTHRNKGRIVNSIWACPSRCSTTVYTTKPRS